MAGTGRFKRTYLSYVLSLLGLPLLYLFTFVGIIIVILLDLINKILQLGKQLFLLKNHLSIPHLSLSLLTLKFCNFIIVLGLTALAGGSTYYLLLRDLPSPNQLTQRPQALTTKITDRQGTVLYKIYKDENRTLVSLNDLPPYVTQATIAIEDKAYYHHLGISPTGITRALYNNLRWGSVQGGSTITQQLVKNALLNKEKTFRRKIREGILAVLVELKYSKEAILEMYLNEVGYGGTAYGIEEASQQYFGKSASSLTLAEAALLAGLPASPTVYSPYGLNPYLAKVRQRQVLSRMVEDKYLTQEEAESAVQETIYLNPSGISITAPHFVMYVKDYLVRKYGEDLVNQGGLEVTTTLDLKLQETLQHEIDNELSSLARLNVSNAAGLVTSPPTGEILAMVGSKNYFDFTHDGQVNVTIQPRQPGSAIKPLTYALAFSRGFTPSTTILDAPVSFTSSGSPPYTPQNYDGRFHGTVSLRTALASSYNIPAIKLLNTLGVGSLVELGRLMGITTWSNSTRFGLSLTLGGGEVTMVDLAQAYGTFANNGVKVTLKPVLRITTSDGQVLEDNSCNPGSCPSQRVLSPLVAFQISDILSDNQARSPAFGVRSALNLPTHQVAVKTGTTNNLRDNWTIGYTSSLLVATWVGNNDNTPMSRVASGVTGASPIWNRVMTNLLPINPRHIFAVPPGLLKVAICPVTNTRYCQACPAHPRHEYYIPGTEPRAACSPETIGQILEGTATQKTTQ